MRALEISSVSCGWWYHNLEHKRMSSTYMSRSHCGPRCANVWSMSLAYINGVVRMPKGERLNTHSPCPVTNAVLCQSAGGNRNLVECRLDIKGRDELRTRHGVDTDFDIAHCPAFLNKEFIHSVTVVNREPGTAIVLAAIVTSDP